MPKCPVCDGEDFDLQDGLYYCTECCTQSQVIREEGLEEDYVEGVRSVRTIKSTHDQRRKRHWIDPGYQWRMVEAYNIILHEQTKALVGLGAGPHFEESVLQLWSRYLYECEHAFVTSNKLWTPRLCSKPYTRDIQVTAGIVVKYRRLVLRGPKMVGLVTKIKKNRPRKKKLPQTQNLQEQEITTTKGKGAKNNKKTKKKTNKKMKKKTNKKMKQKTNKETSDPPPVEKDSGADVLTADPVTGESKKGANTAAAAAELTLDERVKKWRNILKRNCRFSKLARRTFKRMGSKPKTMVSQRLVCLDRTDLLLTISVICLVLRASCHSILLSDVSRWIKEGRIPYMHAYKLLPNEWKIFNYEKTFLSSSVQPTVFVLHTGLLRLARLLGLSSTPVVDVQYVAARYLADMNLPYELLGFVNIVIERFTPKLHRTTKSYNVQQNVEFWAGICILFVLKHIFGLDGKSEKTLSVSIQNDNLERKLAGVEEYFVWSEWQEQMDHVVTYNRTRQPYSLLFSPLECQDVDVLVSHIQSNVPDPSEPEIYSDRKNRRMAENMGSIKRSFSRLTREGRTREPDPLEPATSFPVRTKLGKCFSRIGRVVTDFTKRKIHPSRSSLYWFCQEFTSTSDVHMTQFPESFLVLFHVLQEVLDWKLQEVLPQLKQLENSVFGISQSVGVKLKT